MDAPEPSRGKPAFKTACDQIPLFSSVNVRTAHTIQTRVRQKLSHSTKWSKERKVLLCKVCISNAKTVLVPK